MTLTDLAPSVLTVRAWEDPVLDRLGHDPRSLYCERFWLPMLGPSAVLLARQLADGLERAPDGYEVPAEHAARSLGLGAKGGRRGPFGRTVLRLAQFRVVHFDERTGVLLARRRLPGLSRTQVHKLPVGLQAAHETWIAAEARRGSGDLQVLRERARSLVLTLLQLGEDAGEIERHLHRLRFHPALVRESIAWARSQMAPAPPEPPAEPEPPDPPAAA